MKELTGNKRYRAHKTFFGTVLLVLQVEERSHGHSNGNGADPYDLGYDYDRTYFRDARLEDAEVH